MLRRGGPYSRGLSRQEPICDLVFIARTESRDQVAHDIVPVVMWDSNEFTLGAQHGVAQVIDPESGKRQLVWWRPALRERWRAALEKRRDDLLGLFRAHRLKPLFIEGAFDADAVTKHFHS